jgi:hypothetical protein
MPDTREPRSVIDEAEQAAAAGDYASAEQLLREAALLQEASLGPLHPDLANTLNNLGVVCEVTEKPVDAEHFFRRAYAIATATLEPDHPFVATSRKNLEDFCTARGIAVDPPRAPSSTDDQNAPVTGAAELSLGPPPYEESPPAASRRGTRPLAIGALVAGGLLVTLLATATWLRSNRDVEPPQASPSVPPRSPATTAASRPAKPIGPNSPGEARDTSGAPLDVGPKTGGTPSTTPTGTRVRESSPLVATAQLCRELSTGGRRGSAGDWQCVPPGLPVDPGPLFFYTRLKSATETRVQHRWYRGDRLRQVVELPIRPNTTDGYRTFSRNTVDDQGAGNWRVELRTIDGVLLHEERFVVR